MHSRNRQGWHERLALPRVLTPHPGEMARLLGIDVEEVQRARLQHATEYAQRTGSHVVLKGPGTVVAAPDGRARLSEFASAVLATAGTGDVLAGFIVSLVAQGMDPFDAAAAAVYLHTESGRAVEAPLVRPRRSRRICSARFRRREKLSKANSYGLVRSDVRNGLDCRALPPDTITAHACVRAGGSAAAGRPPRR